MADVDQADLRIDENQKKIDEIAAFRWPISLLVKSTQASLTFRKVKLLQSIE
jgi:hypothetical protein